MPMVHRCFCIFGLVFLPLLSAESQMKSQLSAQQTGCMSWVAVAGSLGTRLRTIELSGNVDYYTGNETHSGSVVLKASGSDSSKIELSTDNGRLVEIRTAFGNLWTDTSGSNHAFPNSGTPNSWFFPGFLPNSQCLSNLQVFTFEESQSTAEINVASHAAISPKTPLGRANLSQHLSAVEYHIDPNSYLPTHIQYNEHPDNDLGTDIPVEIRFADYRQISGVQVPFRIQKFMNGTTVLDITVNTVVINSSFSASEFSIE